MNNQESKSTPEITPSDLPWTIRVWDSVSSVEFTGASWKQDGASWELFDASGVRTSKIIVSTAFNISATQK